MVSCKEVDRGATLAHQGGSGVPWAQDTSTVAVECLAPVSSSEVTCHWPLRDLVPRRVTPFLAFTLGQSRKKKRERVSLRSQGCPPWLPRLGWGWEKGEQVSKLPRVLNSKLETNLGTLVSHSCNLWPSVEAAVPPVISLPGLAILLFAYLSDRGLTASAHITLRFQKAPKRRNLFPIIS